MITGCHGGGKSYEQLWAKSIERLTYQAIERNRSIEWPNLKLYPALLLLYGGGIASVAAGRYDTFATLLTKVIVRVGTEDLPLVLTLHTWNVMNKGIGQQLPNMERHFTPVSEHLYIVLREPLREFLPQDTRYQECFDRFEYLLALVHADLNQKQNGGFWGPVGCFGWRGTGAYHVGEHRIMKEIELEVANADKNWPLLEAGLFDASVERFRTVKTAFDEQVRRISWR
jgi:hypothetical protein